MTAVFVRPEYLVPHYSTKLFKAYYEFIVLNYSPNIFKTACETVGISESFLLSDDNWVSNAFTDIFVKTLVNLTGDEDLAFKVGAFTLNPKSINHVEYNLIKFMPPAAFFLAMPVQSKKINRFHKFQVRWLGFGRFRISLQQLDPNEKVAGGFVENTLGVFHSLEAIHTFSKYSVKIADQPSPSEFSVEINYKQKMSLTQWIWGILLVVGTFIPNLLTRAIGQPTSLELITLTASYYSILLFSMMAVSYIRFIGSNIAYHSQNRAKTQELYEKTVTLDRRYKESNLLRELSYQLIGAHEPEKIISFCLNNLQSKFGFHRLMVMLLDSDSQYLQTLEVRGFHEMRDVLLKLKFRYPAEKNNPQFFANLLDQSRASIIDLDALKKSIKAENKILLDRLDVNSLLVAPIEGTTEKHGLLILGATLGEKVFDQSDLHLIENLTRMLALFFENAKSARQEETLRGIFQKYVPSVVLDSLGIIENKTGAMKPKNDVITSMFVDLRGFTTLSETMAPDKVVDMLNIYVDYVTHFISQVGGIIDNLIGDGIVAFFPENIGSKDGQTLALTCSLHILAHIEDMHRSFENKGYPKAKVGIGLHTGIATIGSVGCDRKLNYTAIGDTVNLASRLQGMIKVFEPEFPSMGGHIILAEETLQKMKVAVTTRNFGFKEVRGRKQPVCIHLIDQKSAQDFCSQTEIDIQKFVA